MLNFLNKLLQAINLSPTDVIGVEDIYKTLAKATRIKLKQLHPDMGGDSNEFNELHKLYEWLLSYKKTTSDYNTKLELSLKVMCNNDNYSNFTELSFDDILSQSVIIPKQRNAKIQVNISELVLHFNRLSYCTVEEILSLLSDTTVINIDITAIEPTDNGETETDSLVIEKRVPYNYTGRYSTDIALELRPDSILKIKPEGFEQTVIKNITSTEGFKLVFEEGAVKLSIIVHVTVK